MSLKVVFFGSPEEATVALVSVLDAGHEVVAVYTRPDREAGRSRKPRPTPVRVEAESRGLVVETPSGLRNTVAQERLSALKADVFVVVAYGRFLPADVLAMPRLGVVNIHPSLLPRHRGPSPVATAILEGDASTGVTLMLLDEGMDTGPVLTQSPPVRLDGTERSGDLTAKLFKIGAEMLPGVLGGLERGLMLPRAQDETAATVTRLIEKDDGRIDWSRRAVEIERMTRAFDPWPGAFTSLDGKNLKVIEANALDGPVEGVATGSPGTVRVRNRRFLVATGNGVLELVTVQPEGKRPMNARDFLNGMPGIAGALLGS